MGAERRTQGGEMLLTLAVGWRASAVKGEEAGHFCEVAGMSIVVAGSPHSVVDTFNCRQPSGLNKFLILILGMSLLQEMIGF